MPRSYKSSMIYKHAATNNPIWCQCRSRFGPRCCQFVLMRIKLTCYQIPQNANLLLMFIQHYVNSLSTIRQDYANMSQIYVQDVAITSVPKAIFILDQVEKSNNTTNSTSRSWTSSRQRATKKICCNNVCLHSYNITC